MVAAASHASVASHPPEATCVPSGQPPAPPPAPPDPLLPELVVAVEVAVLPEADSVPEHAATETATAVKDGSKRCRTMSRRAVQRGCHRNHPLILGQSCARGASR